MILSPGQSLLPSRRAIYIPFTERDDTALDVARWLEENRYEPAAAALRATVQRHQFVTQQELKADTVTRDNLLNQGDIQCRIWSDEHRSYWRAGGCGYCHSALEAGVFPLKEAFQRSSHCGPEKCICYEILPTPDLRASLADMPEWKS